MLSDAGGRDEWLQGQLTINSFQQTMDFVHYSSSADDRLGRRIALGDAPHIGFKCVSVVQADNACGRCFDLHIDLFHFKVVFRFQSFQDALDIHVCLLSYLLFRAMMSYHNALPSRSLALHRSPASPGSLYAKMRLKLLRSITLFLAYKPTVQPASAVSAFSSFPSAGVAATRAWNVPGRIVGRRKAENHAAQLVSRPFSTRQPQSARHMFQIACLRDSWAAASALHSPRKMSDVSVACFVTRHITRNSPG